MRPGDRPFDVLILGAGPAGVAAALGMARLGYRAAVVGRPRAAGIEGLSARSVARLSEAGLGRAARCASRPVPRWVSWAGERSVRGQESLVSREDFDAALRRELAESPVCFRGDTVRRFGFDGGVWKIETGAGLLTGRAVLDARGRRARRSGKRGPLLVAWNAIHPCDAGSTPGSALVALDDGWCWIARTGTGVLSAQFVGAANESWSGGRIAARVRAAARALPEFDLRLEGDRAMREAAATARAAVARYSRPSQGPGFLRIGDAAVAMDPLSGNGIHEALGSARVAVAAIHSYLDGGDWSALARFVDERAAELWRRSVTAAGDFYRRQATHACGGFWAAAASEYERAARDATPLEQGPGRFEMRPVLDGERIDVRKVWVSAHWPRGVWKVNGQALASVSHHEA